jgi:hypothetical protein
MKRLVIALVALTIASPALAADKKIPIYVHGGTPDTNGATYVYQLREHLRASRRYDVVRTQREAIFVIGLVSIDPDKGQRTENLALAAGITLAVYNANGYDYLVGQWVASVGRDRIANSVVDVVAAIDRTVQAVLKALAKMSGVEKTSSSERAW